MIEIPSMDDWYWRKIKEFPTIDEYRFWKFLAVFVLFLYTLLWVFSVFIELTEPLRSLSDKLPVIGVVAIALAYMAQIRKNPGEHHHHG
jgi:uncharacterized membrane-anchored protein